MPESWRVLYRDGNEFKPVRTAGSYGTAKDKFNEVSFDSVETSAIKLEVVLQEEWSAGIQEVVIK